MTELMPSTAADSAITPPEAPAPSGSPVDNPQVPSAGYGQTPPQPEQTQQMSPEQMPSTAGMGGPPAQVQGPMQANIPAKVTPVAPPQSSPNFWHKAVQTLLGEHTEYQQTPNGPVPVTAPNKPGQLFRSILAGALLGASAGAESPQNGWSGAARGAGAAVKGAQEQDQRSQQQAQQQFQNQQEVATKDREKQLVDAQIAHMHAATVSAQHLNDLQDKEYHDKHNSSAQAMINSLTDAGGVPPVDGALPASLSATDLMSAYQKDNKVRQAPDGYVRHFFDKTDSSELTWDDKAGNWVQADGTPANMTDKTMVTVLDVPREAMKVKRPISGKDINAARGLALVDPDKTYQMSPLDMDGLNTHRLNDQLEQARAKAQERQVRAQETANQREADRQRQAEYTDMFNQVRESNTTLQARQKEMMDQSSPDYKAISAQIDANNQRLLDKYNELHPSKTPIKSAVSLPPPPPAEKDPVQTLTDQTVSGTPDLLKPPVELSINGGGALKLSPAADLDGAIDNLRKLYSASQKSPKPMSNDDYSASLSRLSEHYQKLPTAQKQSQKQTETQTESNVKAEIKTRHPEYSSAQIEEAYQDLQRPNIVTHGH